MKTGFDGETLGSTVKRFGTLSSSPLESGSPNMRSDQAERAAVVRWQVIDGGVYQCEGWVIREDSGEYSSFAACLPGVVAQGEDVDHAFFELGRAVAATIASYVDRGEQIPWTSQTIDLQGQEPIAKRWLLVNA